MKARAADESEIDHLANLWYKGWLDAHAEIVPPELRRLRTLESFRERLRKALPDIRVVGPSGSPAGFHLVRLGELYQLFVSRESRGSGVAAALIADAEERLAESGIETAWLSCAIGNNRAARFYQKSGWSLTGSMIDEAETSEGIFALETWRYEKSLTARPIER